MRTTRCFLSLAMVLGFLAEGALSHDVFSRWRRQAVHCQPGDSACHQCSSGCASVAASRLPECCEAYNVCCDEYFSACKKCSSIASKDQYFPEYCCASFTSCCDLITTFTTEVKAPTPVRTKPKPSLKIPEVAAPKPTSFPGTNQDGSQSDFAPGPVFPAAEPQKPAFSQARPGVSQEPAFDPRTPEGEVREPAFSPKTPAVPRRPGSFGGSNSVGSGADNTQRQRVRTQARAQARPATRRGHQQRSRGGVDPASRRGRVTSRGRVAA